jgi:YihY family inner membrane protein
VNPIERGIRRLDALQQRHKPSAFVFGVMKKFGDDNAGALAGNLTRAGFVSLFPLLLVLVTILGVVASSDASLRQQALSSVSDQVPLIGRQLTANVHEMRRSSIIGLVVGLLVLIWGSTGLAQAGLFTMEQVWNLPGPARPGYLQRLGRAALFLGLLGLGVVVTTLLTWLDVYGHHAVGLVVLAPALAGLVNIALYLGSFRILTPKGIPPGELVPGAVTGGLAWTLVQELGAYLIRHSLHSDSVYGVFATVLGLFAWIYLGAQVTVYAAEVNVVLARRLWPRALVQPPLTEADRASMALQALQNQRRKEQLVTVSFSDRQTAEPEPRITPRTPDEVLPPLLARREARRKARQDRWRRRRSPAQRWPQRRLRPRWLRPRWLRPGRVEPRRLEPQHLEPQHLEPQHLEPQRLDRSPHPDPADD